MTPKEISAGRLRSQKIESNEHLTPSELVKWIGAIQAQDFQMAKWAIGIRSEGLSEREIEESFNKGEILRVHLLRPTWHFVTAEDIRWILRLTADKIKSSLKSRHKELGITATVISKTRAIIENSLSIHHNLTREELASEFNKANIKTDRNRLSHILFRAELDGMICSGPVMKRNPTYALLNERVPENKTLTRDESLAQLARLYFRSRCPATLSDFCWWSNLSLSEARGTWESLNNEFTKEVSGKNEYWIPDEFPAVIPDKNSVHLLPAFDEFLISYRDRSSSLPVIHTGKPVSENGMFFPSIVVNGRIAGLWKRTIKKDTVIIETNMFQPVDTGIRELINEKARLFGRFLNKKTEIDGK